jgi:response regulator RpfG family c-di-GMP phosphodiesterase
VLSGIGDGQTVADAVNEAGVHKYLSKNWDAARLLAEVREAYHAMPVPARAAK